MKFIILFDAKNLVRYLPMYIFIVYKSVQDLFVPIKNNPDTLIQFNRLVLWL